MIFYVNTNYLNNIFYVFRLLMIHKANFVRYYLGENCLLLLITLGSLAITAFNLAIFESEEAYGKVGYNACFGRSHEFQVMFYIRSLLKVK